MAGLHALTEISLEFWILIATLLTCAAVISGAITRHQRGVLTQLHCLRAELRHAMKTDRADTP